MAGSKKDFTGSWPAQLSGGEEDKGNHLIYPGIYGREKYILCTRVQIIRSIAGRFFSLGFTRGNCSKMYSFFPVHEVYYIVFKKLANSFYTLRCMSDVCTLPLLFFLRSSSAE